MHFLPIGCTNSHIAKIRRLLDAPRPDLLQNRIFRCIYPQRINTKHTTRTNRMFIEALKTVNISFGPEEEWLIIWKGNFIRKIMSRSYSFDAAQYGPYSERLASHFISAWFEYQPKLTQQVKKLLCDCPLAEHLGIYGTISERTVRIIAGKVLVNATDLIWKEKGMWHVDAGGVFSYPDYLDAKVKLVEFLYNVKVRRENTSCTSYLFSES